MTLPDPTDRIPRYWLMMKRSDMAIPRGTPQDQRAPQRRQRGYQQRLQVAKVLAVIKKLEKKT